MITKYRAYKCVLGPVILIDNIEVLWLVTIHPVTTSWLRYSETTCSTLMSCCKHKQLTRDNFSENRTRYVSVHRSGWRFERDWKCGISEVTVELYKLSYRPLHATREENRPQKRDYRWEIVQWRSIVFFLNYAMPIFYLIYRFCDLYG